MNQNITDKLTAALKFDEETERKHFETIHPVTKYSLHSYLGAKDFNARLAPLYLALVECVKALEFMTMPITGKTPTVESLQDTIANDDARGNKALARLAEVLK